MDDVSGSMEGRGYDVSSCRWRALVDRVVRVSRFMDGRLDGLQQRWRRRGSGCFCRAQAGRRQFPYGWVSSAKRYGFCVGIRWKWRCVCRRAIHARRSVPTVEACAYFRERQCRSVVGSCARWSCDRPRSAEPNALCRWKLFYRGWRRAVASGCYRRHHRRSCAMESEIGRGESGRYAGPCWRLGVHRRRFRSGQCYGGSDHRIDGRTPPKPGGRRCYDRWRDVLEPEYL
jgi:hypothetical protein